MPDRFLHFIRGERVSRKTAENPQIALRMSIGKRCAQGVCVLRGAFWVSTTNPRITTHVLTDATKERSRTCARLQCEGRTELIAAAWMKLDRESLLRFGSSLGLF